MMRAALRWLSAAAIVVAVLGMGLPGCGKDPQPTAPTARATPPKPPEPPPPPAGPALPGVGERRVVVMSIDGLRPDLLLRLPSPHARGLMAGGSFTMWAQTTAVSVTLPSHVSMLTGVAPGRHGIEWNRDLSFTKPVYPSVPTLFERAYAGYTTALVAGKTKFAHLVKPGTLDWAEVVGKGEKWDDAAIASQAVELIREKRPAVLFVHFPDVDASGHRYGWGSEEQLRDVAEADAAVGAVLAALEQMRLREQTLVILTADHGGQGKGHGAEDARSRHIPWIVSGPGVRPNYDLTRQADLTVRVEDTCATACWYLGVKWPGDCEGKPVKAAFTAEAVNGVSGRRAMAE